MNSSTGICNQFILEQNPLEVLKFRNNVLFENENSEAQVSPSLFGKLPDCLIIIRKKIDEQEESLFSSLINFFSSSKPSDSEPDIILKPPKIADDGEQLIEKTYSSFCPLEEHITSQFNYSFGVDTSIVMSIVTYIHNFIQKLEEKEKDDYIAIEEEGGLLVQIEHGQKGEIIFLFFSLIFLKIEKKN